MVESCQATIAPPFPSEQIFGFNLLKLDAESKTPFYCQELIPLGEILSIKISS